MNAFRVRMKGYLYRQKAQISQAMVCLEAAQIVRTPKWIQGEYMKPKEFCAVSLFFPLLTLLRSQLCVRVHYRTISFYSM